MSELTTTNPAIDPIVGGFWVSLFQQKPSFGLQELRGTLPVALATETDLDRHLRKWERPAKFLEIVRTWFRRQREILFEGMSIYGLADTMLGYRQLCAPAKSPAKSPTGGNPSLQEMMYGLIKKQARLIENLPTSDIDDPIYYKPRPFDVVETICRSFRQQLPPDTEAK